MTWTQDDPPGSPAFVGRRINMDDTPTGLAALGGRILAAREQRANEQAATEAAAQEQRDRRRLIAEALRIPETPQENS